MHIELAMHIEPATNIELAQLWGRTPLGLQCIER